MSNKPVFKQTRSYEKRDGVMYSILEKSADYMKQENFKSTTRVEQYCPKVYLENQMKVLPEEIQIRKSNLDAHRERIAAFMKKVGKELETNGYKKFKENFQKMAKYFKLHEAEGKMVQIQRMVDREQVNQENDQELLEHFTLMLEKY